MARYRRRSFRRAKSSMVWQPHWIRERITIGATASNQNKNGILSNGVVPGTGIVGDTGDPFDDDHVLERVIGTMTHDASESVENGKPEYFPFTFGAIRVPKGLTISADDLNLFDPSDVSNFVFIHNGICNADVSLQPQIDRVDSKSKRQFEVGDIIRFVWSVIAPVTVNAGLNVDLTLNVRFLWKLKT